MKYSWKTLHSSPGRARYGVSFVSSKGNILCRLIKIELYKIFAITNRAIKGLHCITNWNFVCVPCFGHTYNVSALILTINVISGVEYFREIILESSRTIVKQPLAFRSRSWSHSMVLFIFMGTFTKSAVGFIWFFKRPVNNNQPERVSHTISQII